MCSVNQNIASDLTLTSLILQEGLVSSTHRGYNVAVKVKTRDDQTVTEGHILI